MNARTCWRGCVLKLANESGSSLQAKHEKEALTMRTRLRRSWYKVVERMILWHVCWKVKGHDGFTNTSACHAYCLHRAWLGNENNLALADNAELITAKTNGELTGPLRALPHLWLLTPNNHFWAPSSAIPNFPQWYISWYHTELHYAIFAAKIVRNKPGNRSLSPYTQSLFICWSNHS